jgi:hypothetical protein
MNNLNKKPMLQYLSLNDQSDKLVDILLKSSVFSRILNSADQLNLPNWYLGAGCISQTVWNYLSKKPLENMISDYDLVYFDKDLSKEKETNFQNQANELYKELGVLIDVVNEARVHLWYEQDYGRKIEPYSNVEDAISSWPSTASCVGVTRRNKNISVYAPFGLHDLFGMIVKANKRQVTPEGYKAKCEKWLKKWGNLKIVDWNNS